MRDITKAMEKEEEYISYRLKGEEPFHLIDAVRECGFDSLDVYFATKNDHQLKSLKFEVVETTPMLAIGAVVKAVATKKPTVVMVDINQTVVWPRNNAEYDKDYCIYHNIPILAVPTAGNGALVSLAGDLGIGICIPQNLGITHEELIDGFIRIFRKYTDKPVCNEGNDIMYDGNKVCGFAFLETSDMVMVISPVSFKEKSELISNVCMKKQTKVPSYIDFMTSDQLREEVAVWLKL